MKVLHKLVHILRLASERILMILTR